MATSIAENLKAQYLAGSERLRLGFEKTRSGRTALQGRTELVDSLAHKLWRHHIDSNFSEPAGLALLAIGGYGRGVLSPYSDIDLLFLCDTDSVAAERKDAIRAMCQDMWDMRLKLSPTTRALEDCDRLHRDNPEFNISLLDCRLLAGDYALFQRLHDQVIPRSVMRDWQELVRLLAEVNEARHHLAGDTIFHLEPNIKEAPGGLRDYNVACWLAKLNGFSRARDWTQVSDHFPASLRDRVQEATDFLVSVRCFLHYRAGRDDNQLNWEAQQAAAEAHIGFDGGRADAAEWMRHYYRHARVINRLVSIMMAEVVPTRSSLFQQFQNWRSRLSTDEFSCVNGRVFLQQPSALISSENFFNCFEFIAQHGLMLAASTNQRIEQALPSVAAMKLSGPQCWEALRKIVIRRHAADALRTMQELGALGLLLPEFRAVEFLVIRDFYHRYTVDEHTFRAIESIHRLRGEKENGNRTLASLVDEIERLDLLILAVLLHDVGKAKADDDHVTGSLEVARKVCRRFELPPEDEDMVCFLVASHLDLSAVMRRDIFAPETIRGLAQQVGSSERLKSLVLLTYADIGAVNPTALSPWKAENLWRVYFATANYMNRSVDDDRFRSQGDDEQLARIRLLGPQLGGRLRDFLEGLPQRYLRVHAADEIVAHVEMASLLDNSVVQTKLKRLRGDFVLTVITRDRPALFATLAGVLVGWGMHILKADAFSNESGIVVDRFVFTDHFHTLEMNVQEWARFQNSFKEVLSGAVPLERLARKGSSRIGKAPRVKVQTSINFDQETSSHSTIVEVVAQDRVGLLHRIAAVLGECGCNIEVALIDTEGEMAIDTFYLRIAGRKLAEEECSQLRTALEMELGS
ncbi:MAG: [protein-PII] uridylyltransferase [Acidobacteria bacterium]|nr:MAG: [protein-PII] uridylyltransferase [Acidobacteriota bacterium]